MIITRPTGIYKTLLPSVESDSTSVLFTISSASPPRSENITVLLPTGLASRTKIKNYTREERRPALGNLVFTSQKTASQFIGSGMKVYSPGQVLDFDINQEDEIQPKFVGDSIETQHDGNFLSFETLGLTAEQDATISLITANAQESIMADMKGLQEQHLKLQANIADYAKQTNEVTKLINGLTIVQSISPSTDIASVITKLELKKATLQSQHDTAIIAINEIPLQLQTKRDELYSIAELLK